MSNRTNNKCAYQNCRNVPSKRLDLSFHRFPLDERTEEWIVRSGNDNLRLLSLSTLHGKRLCSEHFTEDQFGAPTPTLKRRLLYTALPIPYTSSATCTNSSLSTCKVNNSISNDLTVSSTQDLTPNNLITDDNLIQAELCNDSTETNSIADTTISNDHSYYNVIDMDGIADSFGDDESIMEEIVYHDSLDPTNITEIENDEPDIEELEAPIEIPRTSNLAQVDELLTKKVSLLKQKLKEARREIKNLKRPRSPEMNIESIVQGCDVVLNENQLTLLGMQLDNRDIREWKPEEKKLAIPLYKISPDAYEYLREELSLKLPTASTVRRWIQTK